MFQMLLDLSSVAYEEWIWQLIRSTTCTMKKSNEAVELESLWVHALLCSVSLIKGVIQYFLFNQWTLQMWHLTDGSFRTAWHRRASVTRKYLQSYWWIRTATPKGTSTTNVVWLFVSWLRVMLDSIWEPTIFSQSNTGSQINAGSHTQIHK